MCTGLLLPFEEVVFLCPFKATASQAEEEGKTVASETVATSNTDTQNPTGNSRSLSSAGEEKSEGADGVKELAGTVKDSGMNHLLCVQVM